MLNQDWLSKIYSFLIDYGMRFVSAAIILFVGMWMAKVIAHITDRFMAKAKLETTTAAFIRNIVYAGIIIFIFIAVLDKLGVATNSFVAFLGAAGLAIGLSLQGSLSNFASGIILIMFKPFKVGDFIEVSGITGQVVEVQIFTTSLDHLDNRRIIIPNSKITSDKIINYSAIGNRRLDLIFGIPANADIKTSKEILERVVLSDIRVLKDPQPLVALLGLSNNIVSLACRPWVKPHDYNDVYFDTLEKGKIELEKSGISITLLQKDVAGIV